MDDAGAKRKGVAVKVVLLVAGLAFGAGGALGYFKGLRDGYGQAAGNIETFVQEAMKRQGAAGAATLPAASPVPGVKP